MNGIRLFATEARKKVTKVSDKRYALMRDILYEKPRALPKFTAEQQEQHEVIERMWCFHKQREANEFRDLMRKRYECMKRAVEELKNTDPYLYERAKERPEVFRFHGKIRVPTETPPKQ